MSGCKEIDGYWTEENISGSSPLVKLDISNCQDLYLTAARCIATTCHALTELDASETGTLNDAAIETLLTNCTNLTDLNLAFCENLTTVGLEAILKTSKLTQLNIRGSFLSLPSEWVAKLISFKESQITTFPEARIYI